MRFGIIVPTLIGLASSRFHHHTHPEALVQLGIVEKHLNTNEIKAKAKARFMSLMHDAEVKAEHDPAVVKADEQVAKAHAKYLTDSHKAAELLDSIKVRLAEGKKDLAKEDEEWKHESAEIKKFTDSKYKELAETEKKFMALQQKKISSLAEVPMHVQSSFSQLTKGHDGTKAAQEIHAAEKALRELGESIKKRVEGLTHQLMTPGHQFPGEVVV